MFYVLYPQWKPYKIPRFHKVSKFQNIKDRVKMNIFKFSLILLLVCSTTARRKRHAHRCREEVDLEKCEYNLSMHGFDHYLNQSEVGYDDILCMIKWLRDHMGIHIPQRRL
ncbi:uncharacterized protein LOC134686459 [Mytilus trossulus]|uniref:uncharacterized protein LOC134686459 n=1 Tax=Mytilus trossulus TaxID=6551 RepID=UPI003005A63D